MDLNRLPFLKINFFYHQLAPSYQRLFWVLLSQLGLCAGLFLFSYIYPETWALTVSPTPETYAELVKVDEVEHAYRTLPLHFQAYRQITSYSASRILPPDTPVLMGGVLMVVAWTVMITLASTIQSRWAFLFYFLFSLFIHTTGVAQILFPDPIGGRILEFGIIAVFLGLAYAFQSKMLRASMAQRLLLFMGMGTTLFAIAATQGDGWMMHQMLGGSFVYLLVLSLLLILFVAKEPTSLLMYAMTNHKLKERRLKAPFVWTILILWVGLTFIWLDEFLGWGLLNITLPLRPAHVLLISILVTPFTSQNQYNQLRTILNAVGNFTLLLQVWGIIVLSYWWVYTSTYDPVFVYAFERIAAVAFAGIGVAHLLYFFFNFRPLIKERINLYYLLGNGPRYPLGVVWLMGLTLIVVTEGTEKWKSFNLFWHSATIQDADRHLVRGELNEARTLYDVSITATAYSPKANYNLASLLLSDRKELNTALRHYTRAGRTFDFPYGHLNAASLLLADNRAAAAEATLKTGLALHPDSPTLWTSLGNYYFKRKEPDSALLAYQHALQADLELSGVYSNMAQVYWENERPEEAQEFFEAALAVPNAEAAAQTSAIWYTLQTGAQLPISPEALEAEDRLLVYNAHLKYLGETRSTGARTRLKQLADQAQSPDAMLLDAYLMFEEDSIEFALSRMEFLTTNYPRYAGLGNFLLGVSYFKRDLPEVAKVYFQRSGQTDPTGRLYAAKMAIDLGQLDSAAAKLTVLRAEEEPLLEACSREIALLLSAVGQARYADAEWPLADLTYNERVRLGRYADSSQYFSIALTNFQDLILADTQSVIPYLEMGRIYNRYCDTLALENLAYGLEKGAKNPDLQLAYIEALLCQDRFAEAEEAFGKGEKLAEYPSAAAFIEARLALSKADTSQAIEILSRTFEENPLDREAVLALAGIFDSQGDAYAGGALLSEALAYNAYNPDMWAAYARFAEATDAEEDAQYAVLQALELAYSAAQRQRFADEFSRWLSPRE